MTGKIPYYRATEIAEKSWKIENACCESSYALCYLVEGRDYALLIDTILGIGNLKAFCETLTDKPIRLVNTHSHSDHVGGNFFFDHCYMHPRDIGSFQDSIGIPKEKVLEMAREMVLPEYRDLMEPDDNFSDWHPMKVYPVSDGDVFDLGDRQLEVVEVGGHTLGSIVLIDHKTRIAYAGDACNGNTLLEFDNSLPVVAYLRALLHLKEHQAEFDMVYGGHEIFDASIVDEGIETVAKVVAGTDDRCERTGIMGGPVFYAAEKVKDGYERKDGKHFNMSYIPGKVLGPDEPKQVFRMENRSPGGKKNHRRGSAPVICIPEKLFYRTDGEIAGGGANGDLRGSVAAGVTAFAAGQRDVCVHFSAGGVVLQGEAGLSGQFRGHVAGGGADRRIVKAVALTAALSKRFRARWIFPLVEPADRSPTRSAVMPIPPEVEWAATFSASSRSALRDPEVESRLRVLTFPRTISFTSPEVLWAVTAGAVTEAVTSPLVLFRDTLSAAMDGMSISALVAPITAFFSTVPSGRVITRFFAGVFRRIPGLLYCTFRVVPSSFHCSLSSSLMERLAVSSRVTVLSA